jgi:hypothetical protein
VKTQFRFRLTLFAFIFFIISVFQMNMISTEIANAASPYSSVPTQISSIKEKILDSLVTVKYENVTEIAFSADYTISDTTKNEGYNSILISSRGFIDKCFYKTIQERSFATPITYKGNEYKSTCAGFAADDVDFATIKTTVNIPQLSLYDNYWPKENGWVIVAYYLEGTGIILKESKVKLLNRDNYVLGIDKFDPRPVRSGIVFNQQANFVGILTSLGRGTVPSEYFKVHGAPLQCSPAGSDGYAITNCNTRKSLSESAQAGVWTIDETATPKPTPTPTPSPSKSAVDASIEAYDAFNAAVDSYNLGKIAKSDCVKAYQSSNTATRRILNLVSGSKICSSQDVLVNAAYQRLLSLDPAKTTVKDPLVLIDRLNDLTDQFNNFAEAMDLGVVFSEELRDSANDLGDVEALIEVLETYSSSLETVLERLPSKIKNSLYLKAEVVNFIELNNEFLETTEEFKSALSEFSGLSDVDFEALEDFKSSIYLASRLLPSEASMDDAQTNALKVIPSFYCKKGKVLSLPSKGKCSSGFNKIKIDKTW